MHWPVSELGGVAVLQAFVYTEIAVLVRHWFEVSIADSHLEHGARIELRLLAAEPHRGTESAAQRIVADRPLWRADLFDRLDEAPGTFGAAHYHPHFEGVEPSARHFLDELHTAPWDWLHARLTDVSTTVGVPLRDPEREAELVRDDTAAIVAAAQGRAPERCRTKEQCHAWARDAEHAVHLMLGSLARPDLLDRDRAGHWLETRPSAR